MLVIDVKQIREYQPLFVEFDEYTRFLFYNDNVTCVLYKNHFLVFLFGKNDMYMARK